MAVMAVVSTQAPAKQPYPALSRLPQCPRAGPELAESSMAEPPTLEPTRNARHFGLAGLGLMASALGLLWKRHRRLIHRRRRHFLHAAPRVPPPAFSLVPGSRRPPGHSMPRHRIRRFDYDRFYLHLLRDL
jgi:hypothetical protein